MKSARCPTRMLYPSSSFSLISAFVAMFLHRAMHSFIIWLNFVILLSPPPSVLPFLAFVFPNQFIKISLSLSSRMSCVRRSSRDSVGRARRHRRHRAGRLTTGRPARSATGAAAAAAAAASAAAAAVAFAVAAAACGDAGATG